MVPREARERSIKFLSQYNMTTLERNVINSKSWNQLIWHFLLSMPSYPKWRCRQYCGMDEPDNDLDDDIAEDEKEDDTTEKEEEGEAEVDNTDEQEDTQFENIV